MRTELTVDSVRLMPETKLEASLIEHWDKSLNKLMVTKSISIVAGENDLLKRYKNGLLFVFGG